MPIYEPGLEEMVRRNHAEERLTFTTDLPAAVKDSDVVFIAVGTPQGEDGSADLQHVLGVAHEIGRAITKYIVVVDKSTVPVGTAALMKEVYGPFTRTGAPIMMMDTASAELSKYAANSILATRISFMNEIANVCELVGADVDQVRKAIGADRRIGPSFLFPGVGYGGSCFPKD